jgi:tRNA(His) 5'-end guanylyltransferase
VAVGRFVSTSTSTAKEALGSALGFDSRHVSGDLDRFKEFIEKRQTETGGWRGEVREGKVTDR